MARRFTNLAVRYFSYALFSLFRRLMARQSLAVWILLLFFCLTQLPLRAAAPILQNKSRTVNELAGAAASTSALGPNNLLTGASDPDGGTTFTVMSFSVEGVTISVPGSYLIPNPDPRFVGSNIGTITINADGSYSFAAATISRNYKYNLNYGPVPPIIFTVADSQNETSEAVLQLTVTPFNNGPTNRIPSFSTLEDSPLLLNRVNNGVPALSLDDDAKEINGTVTVSILVSKDDLSFTGSMGTISAIPGHGLTVLVRNDNDGLADGKADTLGVTLIGPINEVNAYLADPSGSPIVWTPPADYNFSCTNGSYRTSMVSNDMGNSSYGAPVTTGRDVTRTLLSISAMRDITNDNLVTPFNTSKTFNVLAGTGDATADSFENPTTLVTAVNGAGFISGQSIVLPSGNSVTVNSDGAMTFIPAAGFTGQDSFQYSAGFCQETATVTVDVSPLPVKLIDFSAFAQDTGVDLSWSSAEEMNSEYFLVERSLDAKSWTAIGKVVAGGTRASVRSYIFRDETVAATQTYYRLKMVDLDGSFAYSSLRSVIFMARELKVWPNPASSYFHISGPKNGPVNFFDPAGRKVLQKQMTGGGLDAGGLSAGTYIVSRPGVTGAVRVVIE